MKKFLKIMLFLIIFGIVGIGGYYAYLHFRPVKTRDALTVIPSDAIFAIETNNLTKAWNTINKTKVWEHLISNPFFADINEDIEYTNAILKDNIALDALLSDRKLFMSAHMISGIDYDFIYVVDMLKAPDISSLITGLADYVNFSTQERDFKDAKIIHLIDKKDPTFIVYISFIDNLMLASFSEVLLERAIEQKEDNYWQENKKFQQVMTDTRDRELFDFYFNFSLLDKYLKIYMEDDDEIVKSIAETMQFSALNMKIENERLRFNGFTNTDSTSSYIRALSQINPGKPQAFQVISDQAALYLAICFSNFNDFFRNLQNEFSEDNAGDYETYDKRIAQVEKLLGIDVEEDLCDWIGNEIAFVKLRPSENARVEDVVVAIHTPDIRDAKTGMGHIEGQIRKRTPVKFEVEMYKNFEIHYLNVKGFFKMFLGNLFAKLEKPYFTYIDDAEDFVVFSNSKSALQEMIDDYTMGKTLSHSEDFIDLKDEFANKSNVFMYIQMPKMYTSLHYFADKDTKKDIEENKELILSFARIGFQLQSESNELFANTLIADHDESALYEDQLEKIEKTSYEDLFYLEMDSLGFKLEPNKSELVNNGSYVVYYPDSTLKFEGMIDNGKLNGLGRSYYPDANIASTVNYVNGKLDGEAYFYFDDSKQTKRAEMLFSEDILIETYREFYSNGARKALLNYEEGKLNGDVEFYYESGVIKIKGKYKNGVKHGKWEFFTETGELLSKERWRKGYKR